MVFFSSFFRGLLMVVMTLFEYLILKEGWDYGLKIIRLGLLFIFIVGRRARAISSTSGLRLRMFG